MPTYGKKLLDNNGNVILPKTRSNLVYHTNNQLVSTILDNLSTNISAISTSIANIKNGTTTVGKATALTTNAGDSNTPVYFSNGKPVSTGKSFANYVPKSGGNMTGALTCNANAYTACHNMVAYNKGGWTAQTTNYFWGQYA